MRIDRLAVKNFRRFASAEWHFSPGFNVLIGDNGAGKTAVLDALAIALDPLIYKAAGTTARAIRADDVRRDRNEPQFPVSVEAAGEYLLENAVWRRTLAEKPNAKTSNRDVRDVKRRAEDLFATMRRNEPAVAPVVSYFTTARLWRQKREKLEETVSPGSKLRGYDHCLDAEANDSFLFRWVKTMQLAAMQSALRTGHLDDPSLAIRYAISTCMESGLRFLTFDIRENEVVVGNDNGDHLPFRMLSDGQRNIAAMVLDIGYRCVTLNPHLGSSALVETPGVVLIDEIDLHLHPRWQRRIVDNLRIAFPKIQFFATTHSPLIVQSLRPGELIDMDGREPGEYFRQSVEEILADEMGLPEVRRSREYEEMKRTAAAYFDLLNGGHDMDDKRVRELESKLDEMTLPYHDNPAYPAYRSFLEQRLLVASGNCN
jgi:predicted ATP-binding protein involved in virulence